MLRASLDTFSADEILVMVGRARSSGALRVFGPHTLGSIYCHDGAVTFATVDDRDDLLAVLRRAGFARDGAAGAVHDATSLAEHLMGAGVDMQRLHDFVRHRTEESIFEVSLWDDGHLVFEPGQDHPYGDAFSYPMAMVVDGVRRRRAQWTQLAERVPSPDVVLAQVAGAPGDDGDLTITRTQWRVLAAVDGRRSVAELARSLGTGLFSTVQLLAGLLDAGLVAVVDRPVAEEPLAVATSRPPTYSDGHGITYEVAPHVSGRSSAAASAVEDPLADSLGLSGIDFVVGGDRPSRDLLLRLLSAVKEL